MVTLKNIEQKISGLLLALNKAGYAPKRAILFGSYAKGYPKELSDLDVAVWAEGFTGYPLLDIEKVAPLLRPFHPIELHPFNDRETSADNSFIEEIESTGIDYSNLIPTDKQVLVATE